MWKSWNTSWICMSSMRRGPAHLLCVIPVLVCVLLKRAPELFWESRVTGEHGGPLILESKWPHLMGGCSSAFKPMVTSRLVVLFQWLVWLTLWGLSSIWFFRDRTLSPEIPSLNLGPAVFQNQACMGFVIWKAGMEVVIGEYKCSYN